MTAPLLMTPGPVPVYPEVYEILSQPLIHHRTPEFTEAYVQTLDRLKQVYDTKADVHILTSSGTGAMETAISNTVQAGDKVLSVSVGVFGSRAYKIAQNVGAKAELLEYEMGKGARVAEVKAKIKETGASILTITHNETSTGVTNPIQEICEELKDEVTILVDAISGLGALPYHHDKWGVGITAGGSQKAFAIPPGLAFVAVSDFMWEKIEANKTPRFYFDLREYKKRYEKDKQPPWTPAASLVLALNKALEIMLKDGVDAIYKRQEKFGNAIRAGIKELGLGFLAEEGCRSNTVTSVKVPDGIDVKTIRTTMHQKHNIQIAGGQKGMKGKIFRIGHMGAIGDKDILNTLSALHDSLQVAGFKPAGDPLPAAKEQLK